MEKMLQTAQKAVAEAAEVCRKIQHQLVKEDTLLKKDRSPVTIADYASQAIICRTLKEHFPEVPIVAEEDAADLRLPENKELLEKIGFFLPDWTYEEILQAIDMGNGQPGAVFWTLDPIDGTKGFLRGDQYAVALALIKDGQPQLGILGCPNLPAPSDEKDGTLAFAVSGQGAYVRALHGTAKSALRVSANDAAGDVRFLESVEAGHANHGLQGQVVGGFGRRAKAVRYDSQVKYAVLSQGLADVYLRLPNPKQPDYREKIWDHAAGVAVVREAGGKVTDMFGRELDFTQGKKLRNNTGVIVTNGLLHDEILSKIAEATREA